MYYGNILSIYERWRLSFIPCEQLLACTDSRTLKGLGGHEMLSRLLVFGVLCLALDAERASGGGLDYLTNGWVNAPS